ncbi:MAG: TetR/AcrR family transcriptional regulator [Clostridia bacterium]|nr:TetR/AcrR family transcriptional regulator [Clostridia bacterium]
MDKRNNVRENMLEEGFLLLKEGGLKAINIDYITRQCGISKGSFYSFFETKAEFVYAIMMHKRNQAKQKLQEYLHEGKLSFDDLYQYLLWLAKSDLDIFSHLSEKEQNELKQLWPESYFNNDANNISTVSLVISHIAHPRKDADMLLFANAMKLVALAKAEKRVFSEAAFDKMIETLIRLACECVSLTS